MANGTNPVLGNFQRIAQDHVPLLPAKTQTLQGTSQVAEMGIVYTTIIAKASEDDPVCIFGSLEGTSIQPGAMAYDRHDKRGYYQDLITVTMWLSPSKDKSAPASPVFARVADGPQTLPGTGSSTTSLSISISATISGGFFGDVPTVNAGGSASVSETHSYSHSLLDFETTNTAHPHVIEHQYRMAQTAQGFPYKDVGDLYGTGGDGGFLQGARIDDPPDLAKTNIGLHSMAFWKANHLNDILTPMYLHIEIVQYLHWFEATKFGIGYKPNSGSDTHIVDHVITLATDQLPATTASGKHVNW